jgi:micrococcal nuclease
MTTWRCRANVLRTVDGDTFAADFDLGWGNWLREVTGRPNRVRILGLNTPERGQERYAEATSMLSALLGSQVWITSQKLDSFGRTLADVTTLDGQDVRSAMPQEWWV